MQIFLKVVEESRNAKEMMGWLEGKIKECKVNFDQIKYIYLFCKCDQLFQVEYTGKIHEIAHVAREQVTKKYPFCPDLKFMKLF